LCMVVYLVPRRTRGKRRLQCLRSVARTAKARAILHSLFQHSGPHSDGTSDLSIKVEGRTPHPVTSHALKRADGVEREQPQTEDERREAREEIKRILPRYARINTLWPGMTWAYVQRELQKSGYGLWRPSLSEKRAAKNPALGPDPPKGGGGKLYYRDVHVQDMLVFCPMGQSRTAGVEMFGNASLIFQQKASAFPALALAPPRGACVLDSCAAPGSKTSQMAALMQNEGQIFAFDRDERRLRTLAELMQRQGVTCVEPCQQDFLLASPSAARFAEVTHFLLDPSCSSSGMTAQPYTDAETISELVANQCAIIKHAMKFPACKRIAYSTCSTYQEENEEVVEKVLRSREGKQFKLVEALPWWPHRGLPVFPGAACCVRTYMEDKTIGFFVALFERRTGDMS